MSRAWVLPGVEEGSESFAEARTKAAPAALQISRTTQQGDDIWGLVSKDQRAVAYTVRHPDDIAQPPSPLPSARMGYSRWGCQQDDNANTPMYPSAAMEQPSSDRTAFLRRRGGNVEDPEVGTARLETWPQGPETAKSYHGSMVSIVDQ